MKMSKLNMFITAICVLFLKHGGFYGKHKEIGRLAHLSWTGKTCRGFQKHAFSMLCMHFFIAYQARTFIAESGAFEARV